MRRSIGWLLGCAGIGLLAGVHGVVRWDSAGDAWLAVHLRGAVPVLQAVWPLGSPLASTALAVAATFVARLDWRSRRVAWALLAAGALAELASKVLGLGRPVGVPAVPVLPILRLGLRPAFHVLGGSVPPWLLGALGAVHLRGTYPSGHVMRLALIPGFLLPRRGLRWSLAVAAAAGVAVVATGGHTITDALGGLCLARAVVCFWRETLPPPDPDSPAARPPETPRAASS